MAKIVASMKSMLKAAQAKFSASDSAEAKLKAALCDEEVQGFRVLLDNSIYLVHESRAVLGYFVAGRGRKSFLRILLMSCPTHHLTYLILVKRPKEDSGQKQEPVRYLHKPL